MPRDLARSSKTGHPSGEGVNAEVEIADTAVLLALSGTNNELLKVLGEEAGIGVGLRGNSILLAGEPARVVDRQPWPRKDVRQLGGEYVIGLEQLGRRGNLAALSTCSPSALTLSGSSIAFSS